MRNNVAPLVADNDTKTAPVHVGPAKSFDVVVVVYIYVCVYMLMYAYMHVCIHE
jgi:hypothetical protein